MLEINRNLVSGEVDKRTFFCTVLSKENSTVAITIFCIVCFVAVARGLDVRTSQELDFPLITASKNNISEIHICRPTPLDSLSIPLLVRLSKDVFERRTHVNRKWSFSIFRRLFYPNFWTSLFYNSRDTFKYKLSSVKVL